MLQFENNEKAIANIVVVGVGGAGGNAVNRMINAGLSGVNYIAVNTDKQALGSSLAETKLQIGDKVTAGLGAGGDPEVGQAAAEESIEDIKKFLSGADLVFITAGMGGGTGTGGAPVIAKIAKEMGILTIGVVTKPFSFEGKKRMEPAELGLGYLKKIVDSLVVVPNDKLMFIAEPNTTMIEAFEMADEILKQGVQGIAGLISDTGLINLDFADVKTVMGNRGIAHMGVGKGTGEDKVSDAVKDAIESPLLETSITGAKAILLNVAGGYDLGMLDVNQAADQIEQAADRDAVVIFGASIKEDMSDEMHITVIATGFEDDAVDRVPMADNSDEEDEDKDEIGDSNTGFGIGDDDTSEPEENEPEQESIFPSGEGESSDDSEFTIPGFLKRD